jgi:hypothetical protein
VAGGFGKVLSVLAGEWNELLELHFSQSLVAAIDPRLAEDMLGRVGGNRPFVL